MSAAAWRLAATRARLYRLLSPGLGSVSAAADLSSRATVAALSVMLARPRQVFTSSAVSRSSP